MTVGARKSAMQNLWQSLLEYLWPSRGVPSKPHWRRDALLYLPIAMAIGLAAGPEVFTAMEMTTLLELLGATLFLAAFSAGAQLVWIRFWNALCNVAVPKAQRPILRSCVPAPWRARVLIDVAFNASVLLLVACLTVAWVHWVIHLVA